LWGIDAPEFDQAGARAATRMLATLISDRQLSLELKDVDRFGRQVAIVSVDGLVVNEELIKTGNAWVHDYFCREPVCQRWYAAERRARKERKGLWQKNDPVPPWRWKRYR
jgi:endonuclease YncB( thermonuclease family)